MNFLDKDYVRSVLGGILSKRVEPQPYFGPVGTNNSKGYGVAAYGAAHPLNVSTMPSPGSNMALFTPYVSPFTVWIFPTGGNLDLTGCTTIDPSLRIAHADVTATQYAVAGFSTWIMVPPGATTTAVDVIELPNTRAYYCNVLEYCFTYISEYIYIGHFIGYDYPTNFLSSYAAFYDLLPNQFGKAHCAINYRKGNLIQTATGDSTVVGEHTDLVCANAFAGFNNIVTSQVNAFSQEVEQYLQPFVFGYRAKMIDQAPMQGQYLTTVAP